MEELVVTMAIRPLVAMLRDKVSSYLLDQYNVMEGMEKQHRILKRRLPIILDVITDAEEQAAAHREGAKAWLQELKTVAYEANQVFDEFKYEALRREAKKNGHYKKLGFDVIKLFPTHNRVAFRHRMGSKLCRILEDINVLIAEMHDFGLRWTLLASNQLRQTPVSKEWRQTDYVIIDPQEIASRSRCEDKNNIVKVLLGEASNAHLAVVPIVGMGGLGKTTLAQLIYNQPEIQKHFQLQLWVCVSDTFDVNSVAKSIVEASPKKNYDTDKPPLDRLQKLVSGQRYLLVLDDVWNREVHKWERLKVCLQHGGMGSTVLTTTRDKQVAEIMGADKTYNLNVLKDNFIKEIIEARAFDSKKEKPDQLVKMVDEIVKRCSGSPLAATALGSVLRTKTSVSEWKVVSSRSSICTEETGILPILKLSYNDLPAHMKQCFAFCALFPKDYKINVEKLIQLWIANGFIPEHEEDSLETIGNNIFSELASRSFFLDIEEFKGDMQNQQYCFRTTCKIHDLMHDIAMSVMGKECVVAIKEPSETEWLSDTAKHLFLSCVETEGILNDSLEKKSPAIQTLICDSHMRSSLKHLSKYNTLHALKLCLGTKSFLLKPKYLHHLRYLDLSYSTVKALPEDISILYNLQVLDLSNCYYLERLPMQMKYMTSLRHLYTHGCPELKSMPPGLENLTKLQTLTYFVAAVTGPDCSDVAELQHLNLGGQLELRQIQNVIEAEAKVANLGNKKDLRELTLRWNSACDSKVLDNFEPHDGLQVLKIYSYGGECMGMLQNMVKIHLFHCGRLQFLFRSSTILTFPRLKVLMLEHLLVFERWWQIDERQEKQTIFPVLEKLFISNCGKLVALPEAPLLHGPCGEGAYTLVRSAFPALKVLIMKELESFQRWDAVEETQGEHILFPCLEELSIEKCPKLTALPEAPLLQEPCSEGGYRLVRSAFPVVKVLKMKDLDSFQRWDGVEGTLFPQLEKLSVQKCPKMIDRYLSSLTKLILNLEYTETTSEAECTSIVSVNIKERWNQESPLTVMKLRCCNSFFTVMERRDYFVHVEELEINSLDGCGSLPAVLNLPASLKTLKIAYCSTSIQALACQSGGLQKPEATTSISTSPIMPEPPAASSSDSCKRAFTSSHLECNSGLTSLEYLSGELPSSLEVLRLGRCSTLASLPNEPQKLPRCLQQQLGSIEHKFKVLDARYEGTHVFSVLPMYHVNTFVQVCSDIICDVCSNGSKPKTWKEIPRLVRERRRATRQAREGQQSTMQE
nr:NBS-LRR disease resistance protein [Dasypyrum villosum]